MKNETEIYCVPQKEKRESLSQLVIERLWQFLKAKKWWYFARKQGLHQCTQKYLQTDSSSPLQFERASSAVFLEFDKISLNFSKFAFL